MLPSPCKPGNEISGRLGPTKMIALGQIATHLREHVLSDLVLDAFGNRQKVHLVGQVDHRLDQFCGALIVMDRAYQRLVDLQLCGRAVRAADQAIDEEPWSRNRRQQCACPGRAADAAPARSCPDR